MIKSKTLSIEDMQTYEFVLIGVGRYKVTDYSTCANNKGFTLKGFKPNKSELGKMFGDSNLFLDCRSIDQLINDPGKKNYNITFWKMPMKVIKRSN
jgi:hypothetical protein